MKEPEKLKIFETSHYLFEKELIDEARDDEEGGFVDFADEESGKEIKFRCSKVSKGGFEFNEYKSFGFEDRDENIPDELIEKAISFDEILNVPTYEEVEKIFYGSDDDDEDEEPKSKSKSKSKVDDDEDDDEDEDDEPKSKKKDCKGDCGKCPFGHEFGKDTDDFDDCDDCDLWEKCINSGKKK